MEKQHDGWKSRKFITTCTSAGSVLVASTVALFVGKATFVEWSGFVQIFLPTTLGVLFASSVAEKIKMAQAAK